MILVNTEIFLILDGHRILSASKTLSYAEKGYDSKKRFMPQIKKSMLKN